MSDENQQQRAIEELEQLGLREYEAKCFVSLVKISSGTAREVSEHIDVPRTRVYEAVRSLEAEGLVEIQHSSPQRFRAIPLDDAIDVLEQRHQSRIDRLERALTDIRHDTDANTHIADPEVWSLVGMETITARTKRLIDGADSEVLLLVGDRTAVRNGVGDHLRDATDRGVDVVVGAGSESVRSRLEALTAELHVFESDFEWLSDDARTSQYSVGRLLLVDEHALLASTIDRGDSEIRERGVCGNGSANSLVLVLRGLLSQYLEDAPSA
jgi:sugar-specific transcriptional regulator TrmB